MTDSCQLFNTEYTRNYVKQKLKPREKIVQGGEFEERIEEGQLDPRIASIPSKLDEDAEKLVHENILDYQRSVYQVSYRNPWLPRQGRKDGKEETEVKEKDLQSELVAYIDGLYFNPHTEKILAPPTTAKRMLGYIRPQFLHGGLSIYQDTVGRTGAMIILKEHKRKHSTPAEDMKVPKKGLKIDYCKTDNNEN